MFNKSVLFAVGVLAAFLLGKGTLETPNPVVRAKIEPAYTYNQTIVRKAVLYSEENKLKNEYALIVDMSKNANKHRVYLVNITKQKIEYEGFTSHGRGGGNTRIKAVRFSNTPNSLMSSLGVYKTAGFYQGKHGLSMRLKGLSESNSNAFKRLVTLHPAPYVTPGYVKQNGFPGMSEGCIGLDPAISSSIINKLGVGSLVYVFQ